MLIGLTQQIQRSLLQFLPLPLGEVPRRGGEGVFPLSVTTEGRDSSPIGRAKLIQVDKHKKLYVLVRKHPWPPHL